MGAALHARWNPRATLFKHGVRLATFDFADSSKPSTRTRKRDIAAYRGARARSSSFIGRPSSPPLWCRCATVGHALEADESPPGWLSQEVCVCGLGPAFRSTARGNVGADIRALSRREIRR